MDLIIPTERGLYCPIGDFHIDPWLPVENAVITHAHSDHAQAGSGKYLAAAPSKLVLQRRLGPAPIQFAQYAETIHFGDINLSFHPAGHILGSAQVRLEHKGDVWVFSGDYKTEIDKTCTPIEPVRCNTFITESTFALPIYRWHPQQEVFDEINSWWRENRDKGLATILFCYALGKAQRILSGLDQQIGAIYTHGAVENITQDYRDSAVPMSTTTYVGSMPTGTSYSGSIILAPPSTLSSSWLKQFSPASTGFASGWMRVRGARRRQSIDRGFVLSDHADWPGLLDVIAQTQAERVITTHGYSAVMTRWLTDRGLRADSFVTEFAKDLDETKDPPNEET